MCGQWSTAYRSWFDQLTMAVLSSFEKTLTWVQAPIDGGYGES